MIDLSNFIKENIPLCVCTFGLAILGYLGYHAVRWIIDQCAATKKIDILFKNKINDSTKHNIKVDLSKKHWWTKVTNTNEFSEFKKNWQTLAKSESIRENEVLNLQIRYKSWKFEPTNQSLYGAPFGKIYGVPRNFSMWMPGVALVAAYLAEKKKIEGLYVCETLETLSNQIKKINLNPSNQRYAFILGVFPSGFKNHFPIGFEPNFPQHKVTICIEKKEGELTIALLDSMPMESNKEILPQNLTEKLWEGYDEENKFNCQELAFRAILKACRDAGCQARLLSSQVLRQKSYGCETFALHDAIAYLTDPDFFNKIACTPDKTIKIDHKYEIEVIESLPSEFMIGVQSSQILGEYRKQGEDFNRALLGKKKTLQTYLDENSIKVVNQEGNKKLQNHFITKKSFKYLNFALLSYKHLKANEIKEIINKILI